jgi:hypothetical protein
VTKQIETITPPGKVLHIKEPIWGYFHRKMGLIFEKNEEQTIRPGKKLLNMGASSTTRIVEATDWRHLVPKQPMAA